MQEDLDAALLKCSLRTNWKIESMTRALDWENGDVVSVSLIDHELLIKKKGENK